MRAIVPPDMKEMEDQWQMSPGLISGEHVFLTGFTGCPINGTPPTDPEAQFRIAFDTIGRVLFEGGLDWSDVVDMTSFHIGLADHLPLFKSVRSDYVRRPYPAWTAIEVSGFATPGVIIELKIIARTNRGTS